MSAEQRRIDAQRAGFANWRLWGPYLAERAWGTVPRGLQRHGRRVAILPARPRAEPRLPVERRRTARHLATTSSGCASRSRSGTDEDPILKERAFGLTGREGNHGEDVKEYWYYLDNVPSHAYMRALYKYPQRAFPYERLLEENARRGLTDPEFELLDTGIFDDARYFDVTVEYAKGAPTDLLVRITVANRGPDAAALDLLPTLWFRDTWTWGERGYEPSVSALATTGRIGADPGRARDARPLPHDM